MEFFGKTHQSHPKLPARLAFLEDSSPSDAARVSSSGTVVVCIFVNKNTQNGESNTLKTGSRGHIQIVKYPSEKDNREEGHKFIGSPADI